MIHFWAVEQYKIFEDASMNSVVDCFLTSQTRPLNHCLKKQDKNTSALFKIVHKCHKN